MIFKIVCTECQTEFSPHINGVSLIETAFDPPDIYKITSADEYICPVCKKKIVLVLGTQPWFGHGNMTKQFALDRLSLKPEYCRFSHEWNQRDQKWTFEDAKKRLETEEEE